MDSGQLIFEAAKDSISRLRWFLLATTLLSSLILMHLYLEKYETNISQFQGTIVDDVRRAAKLQNDSLFRKCYVAKSCDLFREADEVLLRSGSTFGINIYPGRFAELAVLERSLVDRLAQSEARHQFHLGTDSDGIEADLNNFAEKKVRYLRTYNDLNDFKMHDRKLPIFDFEMDANDYVPAMAIILSIMIAGVWLSASSLEAALMALDKSSGGRAYIDVVKLYLTFLFPGGEGEVKFINKALLYVAIWIPFASLLVSAIIDLWPLLLNSEEAIFPNDAVVGFRYAFLATSLLWSWFFAKRGQQVAENIKAIVYPKPMPHISI